MQQTRDGSERPKFQRKFILVPLQACPGDGSQNPVCQTSHWRLPANGYRSITDSNVLSHALDLLVVPSIEPWKALKLRIEFRPLFQASRFAQAHLHCAAKVRRPGIRGVDIAVKFRGRKLRLDRTH